MYQKTYSYGISGLDVYPLEIEVDVHPGLPAFHIVGLPDNAIKESKERVRSAIRNTDYAWKPRRITVNLSPAHIKKEGPAFDLAICLGILAATEEITFPDLDQFILLGALSLDATLQPVRGALPIALSTQAKNFQGIIVPFANADEAAINTHLPVFAVKTLADAITLLSHPEKRIPYQSQKQLSHQKRKNNLDFKDVKGQRHVKRGLEIAAAGGHNVLMIGPPGSGKSMLAKRFPSILPHLNETEKIEVTKIHSIMGLLCRSTHLVQARPFRAPHHTTSDVAIVGGGSIPKPGAVTLCHHGVLFLDELPEFNRNVIECLRQPLEDGYVNIARAHQTSRFPAKFILVAAMNPCPCGFFTDPKRTCRCTTLQIQKYLSKVSGPLLDRLDIHLEVPAVPMDDFIQKSVSECSSVIQKRTTQAWQQSQQRFHGTTIMNNAQMSHTDIEKYCDISSTAQQLLKDAMVQLKLSARAYDKIIRISQTIADLEQSKYIEDDHMAEAISYRSLDRDYWR